MEICCKCPNPVRSKDQRYCNACNAEAVRRFREQRAADEGRLSAFHVERERRKSRLRYPPR